MNEQNRKDAERDIRTGSQPQADGAKAVQQQEEIASKQKPTTPNKAGSEVVKEQEGIAAGKGRSEKGASAGPG